MLVFESLDFMLKLLKIIYSKTAVFEHFKIVPSFSWSWNVMSQINA